MKILLVHNKYQQKGGEDTVFESEFKMLKNHGEVVGKLVFSNDEINFLISKIKIGIYSFYNKNSAKKLEKKIETFKPDIIHVHNFFPIASPSIFYVANKLNIPIVITLHNYRLICPNALLFTNNEICEKCVNNVFPVDAVLHGCYRESKIQTFSLALMSYAHKKRKTWQTKVDRYISLTEFTKNKFLNSSLNLNANKIVVKPNFVEDNGFNYDKEEYFLFVGRLSIEKGIELLLKSFEENHKKLLIIGSGPLESMVKESVQRNRNIKYLGYQNKNFIMDKLKKAKALIFTSIWYETFGMTIIEAFSTATPVICGDIGGPAEIVENEKNGLLYKVGNPEDLQKKIEKLYTDNNSYKSLCEHARQTFEKKYSEEKNYIQLIDIYKEVIGGKK